MVKPEWGKKQTCPKCGERFYDLGNDDPVVCIACGVDFRPDPVLKSKQAIVREVKPEKKEEEKSEDEDDEDDIDLDSDKADNVSLDNEDNAEVAGMVDNKLSSDDA